MPEKILTEMEKVAFRALIKYPLMNDRELSETVNIKLSTITAIRRRLRERGVFRTYRIPMLQKLGMEIISLSYGSMFRMSPDSAFMDRIKDFILVKNSIYAMTDMNHDLLLAFMPNYTEFKKGIEQFERFFFMHNPQPEDRMDTVLFPTGDRVMTLSFFDYTPVLEKIFMNEVVSGNEEEYIEMGERRLNRKEKKAFINFVTHPEATDKAVAEMAGISRQAASVMKARFYREGLMKKVRILDLSKLGLEIIGFTHIRFAPEFGLEERRDREILMSAQMPHFFTLFNSTDAVIISAHRSFEEYSRDVYNLLSAYRKNEGMVERTTTNLFSVEQNRALKMHDYSDLLSLI